MHIPAPNPTGYSLGEEGIHNSLGGTMNFLKPPDTPPASPTLSSFTFTSSMHTRPFREDGGRLYNAAQEDYSLPADSQEVDRLNIQHLAYKARVGKNYVGPLEEVLKGTEGKRVVDLGCGTGLWTIEVGKDFPQHEFIGLDLVPIQPTQDELPENVSFVQDDVTIGLPWPDQTVDVIHARMLFAGIRDYSAIVREAARVLKPNGLFLVIEGIHFDAGDQGELGDLVRDSPHLVGQITDGFRKYAPGMAAWLTASHRAFHARGLDPYASVTVPEMVRQSPDFGSVSTTFVDLPLSPWSRDRTLNKVGRLMYQDARTFPELMKLFITDGLKMDRQEYANLCARFSAELSDLNTKPILYFPASWAIRL